MRIFLLALLCFSPLTHADDVTALDWLNKMSESLNTKQYKASIIQIQADHVRPLVYIQGQVDNETVSFLEYLNGPPKNAVKVGSKVTFLEHDQPPYTVAANRIQGIWPAALFSDLTKLSEGYQFVLGGRARIAGRAGQMIRFIAKDDLRYDAQIWVDVDTYLPLRFDSLNQDKQLLEQTMVVELVELSEPAPLLIEATKQEWPAVFNQADRIQAQNWKFTWLPAGFEMLASDNHRLIGIHEPVEYISLTDGLTNISVYVARASDVPMPEEVVMRNGLSMVLERVGNAEVVAIGRAPTHTLERIAKSLALK